MPRDSENEKSRRWRAKHPEKAREVTRNASRRWRAKHPELARERNRNYQQNRVGRFMQIVKEAKKDKCERCGSSERLEFHHRDPAQKRFTIGKSLSRRSEATLREELAKCDTLCHDCHAKEHRPG